MNGEKYIISDFCRISKGKIDHNNNIIFKGTEQQPASFFIESYKFLGINYPKFHKMDNLCKLGFLASEILLNGKNLDQKYNGSDIGIILYNAASSIDSDRIHQKSIQDRNSYFPSPSVFVYTLANIVIGEICIKNKFYGENAFFITERYNSAELHSYLQQLFNDNILECCITGWLEMDGHSYDGLLYLIEKSSANNEGIVIFEPEKLTEIYLQRT